VRRLLPSPADDVDPLEVYADMPEAEGRPAVRLNMVASADGATAVDGVSGPLGGPGDRRVYGVLRSLTDVVLVGAGTVRAERYGPPSLPPELAGPRRERGQAPLPRIAVVSHSLMLDWSAPLFAEQTSRPIVIARGGAPADAKARAAEVADLVVAGEDRVDLRAALGELGGMGARSVLCEGGPTLNGALAAAGLVDELCLTLSSLQVGGDARRVLAGPLLSPPLRLDLGSVLEEDGSLFLRLRRAGTGA
jgi:riboflavin biosynthesis pyrimidine reductase